MAVTSSLDKITVTLRLNNGLDPHGNVSTVNLSMPRLSTTGYGGNITEGRQKIMSVIGNVENVLGKAIYQIREVQTSTLEEE